VLHNHNFNDNRIQKKTSHVACSFALNQLFTGTIPNNTAVFSGRTRSHCHVRLHNIAVLFAQMFCFRFSFVIVLVLVRSARCNFYFYIVFVSQIVIILVFVLIERSVIILVFVFVTKIALERGCRIREGYEKYAIFSQ